MLFRRASASKGYQRVEPKCRVKTLFYVISSNNRTAGYTWTDHKANTEIAKELNIIPALHKIQNYKRNWVQHVNRMPRNRLPRLIKKTTPPKGRRNLGRPLKRLLDASDQKGSTNGPIP
jgi:hypothetical protein